jgi:hypothetical protein
MNVRSSVNGGEAGIDTGGLKSEAGSPIGKGIFEF